MTIFNEVKLAKELIKFPSITPIDAGVMKFLEKKLKKLGFKTKIIEFKEKNFKLAILSNGTPSLLKELVKSNKLDNIFDDLFSIEEVGIYKPDSKVYDMPINKYQIKKEEIAFLSANTWDVSGGGNYGYNSIWVNRNNNIFDNLDYKPQNEIKNLSDLVKLV